MVRSMAFHNRVTELLGIDIPIFQAPMGYVAKPPLVAAVSEAGAMGLVPGSLGLEVVRDDIRRTRELTDKPFGVNLPLAFLQDASIVQMIVDEGVEFVTTSAGSPDKYGPLLKEAGLIVFHVVPTLKGAQRAVDAGVDGLVVEGSEGAGFKNPRDVTSMVLLPLIASRLDVPIVAAGGMADGASMAAAFALGAEGVQMGTRMLSSIESGVHQNMKQAVVDAAETDTMLINQHNRKPVRVLRTATTERFENWPARAIRWRCSATSWTSTEDGEHGGLAAPARRRGRAHRGDPPGGRDHPADRRGVRRGPRRPGPAVSRRRGSRCRA